MRRFIAGYVAAFLVLPILSLHAQWINYPTAGVPKDPHGRLKLNARAPRSARGKPDFSGIWIDSDAIQDPSCTDDEFKNGCIRQEGLPIRAVNIGIASRAQFDRIVQGESLIGLLPYQPWAADLVKERVAFAARGEGGSNGGANIDPHARCLPPNFPRAWALPQYKKIVQTPGLIVILDEFGASYRQIFTDGRPLPVDPQPSWNGYSTGRWEGDTLVVETTGFRNDLWLDMSGSPLTEDAKVIERIRRPTYWTLEIQVTVDDPKAYTKRWSVQMNQSIAVDTDLLDNICLENEKDVEHFVGR
jgi:hypothetical protein